VGGGEVERAGAHRRVAGGERRGLPRRGGAGGEIVAEAEEDEAAEQRDQLALSAEGGAGLLVQRRAVMAGTEVGGDGVIEAKKRREGREVVMRMSDAGGVPA